MKNLVIYSGVDKLGDSVLVKTVDSYEDFKKGIKVFSLPPYNEVLSEEDCRQEYESYEKNGEVFGVYVDGKIAGINCILYDDPEEYSIGFRDPVAYYSGLAVIQDYRKRGLGKILVRETQRFIEESKECSYSFARILCEGSMSEGIFKLNGFEDAFIGKDLIVDEVSYERNDSGEVKTDKRKYMVKKILNNTNGIYRR